MATDRLRFCERFVFLDGQPIRFDGRPYLRQIYASMGHSLVIRASR